MILCTARHAPEDLRTKYGVRSLPVRRDDEAEKHISVSLSPSLRP